MSKNLKTSISKTTFFSSAAILIDFLLTTEHAETAEEKERPDSG